ncbi:MAG: serine/threonine protein kinase [Chloroflexi bacterium]|nr:serine/threonine protein kinase [Chloroflexota bacterium]
MNSYSEGDMIAGRYKIIKKLGSGGTGCIYLVKDSEKGETFALKHMLPPGTEEDAARIEKEFLKEADILKKLDHPAIPAIYDYFSGTDGYYLVMEYINGSSLKEELTKTGRPFPEEKVIDISLQVCNVLEYLHGHEEGTLLFRDLKPSNIMVTPEDKVYLIDFGLVKKIQPGGSRSTIHLGTVGYAPPEQYEDDGVLGPPSDIYSLGATMFQLVTGEDPTQRPPFELPDPRVINKKISSGLDSIIRKALNYDQEKRFQSAAELLTVLKRIGSDRTLTVEQLYGEKKRPGLSPDKLKFWLLLFLLLTLFVILFYQTRRVSVENKSQISDISIQPYNSARIGIAVDADAKPEIAFTIMMTDLQLDEMPGTPRDLLIKPVMEMYKEKGKESLENSMSPDIPNPIFEQKLSLTLSETYHRGFSGFYPFNSGAGDPSTSPPWDKYEVFEGEPGEEVFIFEDALKKILKRLPVQIGGDGGNRAKIITGKDGTYWLLFNDGFHSALFEYTAGSVKSYKNKMYENAFSDLEAVSDMTLDSNGNLWMAVDDRGSYDSPAKFLVNNGQGLTMLQLQNRKSPTGIFSDNLGRIWYSQNYQDLYCLFQLISVMDKPKVSTPDIVGTYSPLKVYWVLDSKGRLFRGTGAGQDFVNWKKVSSGPGDLLSFNANEVRTQDFDVQIAYDKRSFGEQTHIYADKKGSLWVSRMDTLYCFENNRWNRIPFPEKIADWLKKDKMINGIKVDKNGNLWLKVIAGTSFGGSTYSYQDEAVLVRCRDGWFVFF